MSEVLEQSSADETTPGTAMVAVRTALPTVLAADKDDVLGKLAAELKDYTPDASTEKGRAEIGSKKRKAGVARQDVIRLADGLKEGAQKTIKGVNAEVKIINERFDVLIDWIEAPRIAYQEREKARVAAHEAALAEIEILAGLVGDHTTTEIADRLTHTPAISDRDWQEFRTRAERAIAVTSERLTTAHAAAEKREAEAAELERLRAEEDERQRLAGHQCALNLIRNMRVMAETEPTSANFRVQIDRLARLPDRDWEEFADEAVQAKWQTHDNLQGRLNEAAEREDEERRQHDAQIAAEAAEAARQEEQAKAKREAEEAARKSAAEKAEAERKAREALEAAERARKEAEAKAKRDRLAAEQRADQERDAAARREREAHEAAEKAEAARIAAEQKAERDRIAAAERAEREKVAAVEAERHRQEAETKHQAEEEARRAADVSHRRQTNRETALDLQQNIQMADGHSLPSDVAQAIVIAIARRLIRHVSIGY